MGLVFFVPAVTTPNNDQSQKGDFYKKQVQVLTFTSVKFFSWEFCRLEFLSTYLKFGLVILTWQSIRHSAWFKRIKNIGMLFHLSKDLKLEVF